MLTQFRFQNFKSFRDDTILDLTATRISEHSARVISAGGEKFLPVAAIYGANASGKSNVVEAFRFMTTYVIRSFAYGGDGEKGLDEALKHTPFLFDPESVDAESSFEVYFMDTEENSYKSYNYGFTLNRNGVAEEWLNIKAKTARKYKSVFYRNGEELELYGIPIKNQENIQIALEKEVLIVSLGAKLKIAKLKKVRDWFYAANFINFGDPIENVFLSRTFPREFMENTSVREKVIRYLSSFDSSIVDFQFEKLESSKNDDEQFNIYAIHRTITGGTARIPLNEESGGTLKMFALYPALQKTLANGSILLVDELNARLHPLLVRNFLLAFLNPEINTNHAQIVFTTHDSWQISTNLLRRDEIWFTEKSAEGVSNLYSLADFVTEDGLKIRRDENYARNYLTGKYGAIPTLHSLDMFRDDNDGKIR